jgi:hypothetical protein
MTDAKLLKFVTDFRRGIVGRKGSDCMCFAICAPLVTLLNMSGVESILRDGWIKYEIGRGNHYWIELADGRVIDPTADQFNRRLGKAMPKVYLGSPDILIHGSVGSQQPQENAK